MQRTTMRTPPDHKFASSPSSSGTAFEKSHLRNSSFSSSCSDDSTPSHHARQTAAAAASTNQGDLPPPVLVYHASARSIVFRDQLRRAALKKHEAEQQHVRDKDKKAAAALLEQMSKVQGDSAHQSASSDLMQQQIMGTLLPETETLVAGYIAKTEPLQPLELGPNDDFLPLLQQQLPVTDNKNEPSSLLLSEAEREIVTRLHEQRAVVKTIQNEDWTAFVQRFVNTRTSTHGLHPNHIDKAPDSSHPFNSFITSTTLLPSDGRKMRCYGSTTSYTVGVVFALPDFESPEEEGEAATQSLTWAWPAGYSAKTEFNRSSQGMLINGRQEALQPLSVLREYNSDYLTKKEYMVGLRKVSGLTAIPYNEVFLRVGGFGRLVGDKDVASDRECKRSFDEGVGLPAALFVRTGHFGHLITLLRTRARLMHVWGEEHVKSMPLLYITPEDGVKVLTESLQQELWRIAASNLNPFQNTNIAYKTTVAHTDEASFQQKVEELLELDESIQSILTPEELARLAGGFGATDYSVASILKQVMENDRKENLAHDDGEVESHKLQDVVNEGMAAAVRSGDYHTSRQLLILYSLVASSQPSEASNTEEASEAEHHESDQSHPATSPTLTRTSSLGRDPASMKKELEVAVTCTANNDLMHLPAPPPPPPLDTDRLRSATNSDGLLAVLGAAQVLRAMQDGSAQKRAFEAVAAVEEWVNYGEQSMAFRISSWYDQKAAQGDLQIASENPSNFMAFVSNKAITNRKNFAEQLKNAVSNTDFSSFRFIKAIDAMLSRMHSPCLRLELLQYILGLDNRFSVAHVSRSVELAATCLGISQGSQYIINSDSM